MQKWLIGIDEAGRGPLAGPVAVGVVLVPTDFDWSLLPGVGDSKQLSPKKREVLFQQTKNLKRAGHLDFAVSLVAAAVIDTQGIQSAVRQGVEKGLQTVCQAQLVIKPTDVVVKLDGSLKAPAEYSNQETIIKGDASESVIGLASIMAKVTRDNYMVKLAKRPEYEVYDLATHKGYGTKAHRRAIETYGCTAIHRRTYCKNILKE